MAKTFPRLNLSANSLTICTKPCRLFPFPPSLLKAAGYLGDKIEFSQRSLPINSATVERLSGSLFIDSSHIRATLNWQPPFTLDQGLEQTIQA